MCESAGVRARVCGKNQQRAETLLWDGIDGDFRI